VTETRSNNIIGERIRALRRKRGLTLQDMGARTNLSPSYLSQVENGRANVTLNALHSITQELGVPLAELFTNENASRVSVVRSRERRSYPLEHGGTEHLLFGLVRRSLQVAILELPRGGTYPVSDAHPGEEFTYVLSGRVGIRLGDPAGQGQYYELDADDIVYYNSALPHRWENIGPHTATFMVVNTPASY
jgi:transcriptional regulator with XRE-family HTH domain